jgi:hypothetical protein
VFLLLPPHANRPARTSRGKLRLRNFWNDLELETGEGLFDIVVFTSIWFR